MHVLCVSDAEPLDILREYLQDERSNRFLVVLFFPTPLARPPHRCLCVHKTAWRSPEAVSLMPTTCPRALMAKAWLKAPPKVGEVRLEQLSFKSALMRFWAVVCWAQGQHPDQGVAVGITRRC